LFVRQSELHINLLSETIECLSSAASRVLQLPKDFLAAG
jgi:hypothetical protein